MLIKSVDRPTPMNVFQADAALTDFSQRLLQDPSNFVANGALPAVAVTKPEGKFYDWSQADLNRNEVRERAPGTPAARTGYNVSTKTYSCLVKALSTSIADETVDYADAPIRPFINATEALMNQMMIEREATVGGALLASSVWTGGTTAANWASDNPITQIRTAKRAVLGATGFMPNRLWVSRDGYDNLVDNANVLARINAGGTIDRPAQALTNSLVNLFALEAIHVSDAIRTTSEKGAGTETSDFIISDKALLFYSPSNVGVDSITAASFFQLTGARGTPNAGGVAVQSIYVPLEHATVVEAQTAYGVEIVQPKLGYYFSSV